MLTQSGYDKLADGTRQFQRENRRNPNNEEIRGIERRLRIKVYDPAVLKGMHLLFGAWTVVLWTAPFLVSWTWFNAREQQTREISNNQNENG